MYLEKAEIRNFRGIRELKIDFEEECTVLIGENSWGKSSLLRGLWTVLGCGEQLCSFTKEDLYIPIPLLDEDTESHACDNYANGFASFTAETDKRPYLNFFNEFRKRRDRTLKEMQLAAENGSSFYKKEFEFSRCDVFRKKTDVLQFDLIFAEGTSGSELLNHESLRKFWSYSNDGVYRLHWRIKARDHNGKFETRHDLLCRSGASFVEQKSAILTIIKLNPVMRIRDQRMQSSSPSDEKRLHGEGGQIFESLSNAFKNDVAISAPEMRHQLESLDEFSRRYLGNYSGQRIIPLSSGNGRNTDIIGRPVSIETMSTLRETMQRPGINKVKVLTTLLAGVVMSSQGDRVICKEASPIIIFEDIEARFHPSLLLSFWSIINAVPVQKIVTTNSGDLLSAIPLQALRRLYRPYYDTRSYKADLHSLSTDDQRRIAFHLRINRPMTFFARTWLLVEGETEIWVLSQAAAIMGISLQCNGIRPLEFAPCGLSPIIKLARQLGIAFYVVTDGDDAGKSYCDVVRNYVPPKRLPAHLTQLPAKDIEHYLYHAGYADVYLRCAGIRGALRKGTSVDKIIDIAIRKRSKPGLAVEVIAEMQRRGCKGVPPAIVDLINRLTALSRGDFL